MFRKLRNKAVLLFVLPFLFACQNRDELQSVDFMGRKFERDITFSLAGNLSSIAKQKKKEDTVLTYDAKNRRFEISSFFEGSKMGEELIYEESRLTNYLYRCLHHDVSFAITYDSLKNIINIEGHGIPEKYLSNDSVVIDSIIEINMILASPPFFRRKLYYGLCDENRKFTTKDSIELNNETTMDILMKFETSGEYRWQSELVFYSPKDTFSYKSFSIIHVLGNKEGQQKMKIKKDYYGRSLYSFLSKLDSLPK